MEKVLRKLSVIIVLLLVIAMCGSFFVLVLGNQEKPDTDNNDNGLSNEQQPVDWSQVIISCFGDSLTAGGYLGKGGVTYPQTLHKQLNTFACVNYGKGSSTVGVTNNCSCHPDVVNAHNAGCLRYTDITTVSDIIIVMFGPNDCSYTDLGSGIDETNINTFYGGLNILCSGLKKNYPNAWIFFMTGFDWPFLSTENSFGISRKDYFPTPVKEVCGKYGIDVFDTFNELTFDASEDLVDGVHVTQDFINTVWVPAIARYIKANYPGKAA